MNQNDIDCVQKKTPTHIIISLENVDLYKIFRECLW